MNFPIVVAIIKPYLKKSLIKKLLTKKQKNSFISSAVKCHRDDFVIEKKKIINEHFIQKLEKKIFFCPI